ncbi:alpha/beta fold hydrolase [Gordonia hydrophobica]|uniref:Alpha/beta fold hydrolase n=1 Tax=Gordonia hydrophobica TaxID=40516 RepID=A0ABZ2TYI1_9ACTN|nr:alpha/beta fold hydrolase [Gordonia hydrophobica]MBM7366974.1 pimeloyl-ACP methyl ester carboxylesterase [Gordonia hydrophobica]
MKSFSRAGLTFDVVDAGTATNGTVVLLHGFPQTSHSWRAVTQILVERGYRTIAPDQRGYSPQARPRGRYAYRIGELVSDIESLIIQSDAGRVHLVGHDWGAQVAWMLAAARPDLISTLTTVSVPHPAAFVASMTQSDQLRRSWYMAAFQPPKLPELLIDRKPQVLDRMLAETGMDPEMIADTHRLVVDSGALTGGLNWYRAIPFGRPGEIRKRIAVPTTHVWSTGDTALARRGADLAGRHVDADYRLVVMDDATHWIPEQNPAEIAEIILDRIEG